jgi:hypothetical protein
MTKDLLYWGYIDDQNKIEVKRYINDRQIQNYEALPFVKGIFDPFYAANIRQATEMILDKYREEIKKDTH